MLNYLWAFMILIGILYGGVTGKMEAVGNGALQSAGDAVTLSITMLGIVALWSGIMEVAKKSGIISGATKRIRPFVRFLFPRIPDGHPALEYITTNFIANFLGLGWAATPAGLKAMEELEKIDQERHGGKTTGIASNEMCTFLILNISSLQLIPVNMIAYRSQYGSLSPTAVVAPAIIATLFSTIIGVIYIKLMDHKAENPEKTQKYVLTDKT